MQEKPIYIHLEMHKEIVKNAWIISHEGRKILVIEFQEDESVAYVFALAKSLVSEKNTKELSPEVMRMVRGTYVRILDAEMQELIDSGIEMEK